jgi:YVTN family beta-propeller protein/YD repeat-containing protein
MPAGQPYRYQASAFDPDGDSITYVLARGPAGMAVDGTSGRVTWTPAVSSPAQASVVLQAYDAAGAYVTQAFTVAVSGVNTPPVFGGLQATVTGPENQPLSVPIQASDADGDPLLYWADHLPPGAVFDPVNQLLLWTPGPHSAGTYPNVTFWVSDGLNQVSETTTIVITPNPLPPALVRPGDLHVQEGQPVQFQLQASDPDGLTITYHSDLLPPGAFLDPNTGQFQWTPDYTQHGVYHIPFRATDANGSTAQTATVTVLNVNAAPVFQTPLTFSVPQGQPLQFRALAFDPDNPAFVAPTRASDGTLLPGPFGPATVAESASGGPATATFDTSTFLYTWTPAFTDLGVFHVTFTATDNGDGTGTPLTGTGVATVTVTPVNRPPQITPVANQTVKGGATLDLTVQAPDPDDDKRTLTQLGLPSFGTFTDNGDGTGTFHFAPGATDGGNYTITLTATDDGEGGTTPPLSASQSFVVTVQAPPPPPRLDFVGDKVAVIGQALQFTLSAHDRDQLPLTFTATGLPAAAAVTPSAVYGKATVTWTPTAADAGTYGVVFQVADNGNGDPTHIGTDQRAVKLVVRAADQAPVVAPVADPSTPEGQTLTVTPAGSDPDGDGLTWSVANLPTGAAFDPATGTLTWKPTLAQVGDYPGVKLTAGDGSLSASQTFTIHVTPVNLAPVLVPVLSQSGREGALLKFTLVASDLDGDKVTFVATQPLPTGATLNAQTGEVDWTPTFDQAGDYTFHLAAQDPSALQATADVPVHIDNVDRAPTLQPVPNRSTLLGQPLHIALSASDPDTGTVFTYSAKGLPDGATFNPTTGAFDWTPGPAQAGTYVLTFTVSDGQLTAQQITEVRALQTLPLPDVTLVVTPSFPAVPGQTVVINVSADSFSGITNRTLTANGQSLTLDSQGRAQYVPAAPGRITLVATATDGDGQVRQVTGVLKVRDPNVTAAPAVSLNPFPATGPLAAAADVTGTVNSGDLDTWVLDLAPLGSSNFVTLATGNTNVAGGALAHLDPARFRNGVYVLRLTATDLGENSTQTTRQIEIDTEAKPAQYLRAETDLSVPLGATALKLTRVYDSLAAGVPGSFGYGWYLAVREAGVQTSVPATGRESLGAYNPFQQGTRVYLTLPDGRRVGFTFAPVKHQQPGLTWYAPAWVADAGVNYTLDSAGGTLTRGPGGYYDLLTAGPYNPASGRFNGPDYTLTAPDGTAYQISTARGVEKAILPGGESITFSDSGITSSTGAVIQLVHDKSGRVTQALAPDGTRLLYAYDAQGNLATVTDAASSRATQYGYSGDGAHLLTLVVTPAGGAQIAYGAAPLVTPLQGNLGSAINFVGRDSPGTLGAGATDTYAFTVKPSELRSTNSGTVLIGVRVQAGAGSTLQPGVPSIDGLTPLVQHTGGGSAFALFRIARDGEELLRVTGATAATAGAYQLHLFLAGDANEDGFVDGIDGGLLTAGLGATSQQAGYSPGADGNGDGVLDATDIQLLASNLGFRRNGPPAAQNGSAMTHADLAVSIDLSGLTEDPEGDPVFYVLQGAQHGTVALNSDGHSVTFLPDPGYTGPASFAFTASDGTGVSAPATVAVNVSAAPLVGIDVANRGIALDPGQDARLQLLGNFTDQSGVPLPPAYVTFASTNPAAATVTAGVVHAVADGVTTVTITSHAIKAAAVVTVGPPTDAKSQSLSILGLNVFPAAVSLVIGGTRRIDAGVGSTSHLVPNYPGTVYLTSNPLVATVSADGVITAVAAGKATVTVINGPGEATIPVLVTAPQVGPVALDANGGVVQGSDGSQVAVPPGDVQAGTTVSITPLTQADLNYPTPAGFPIAGRFQLDVGASSLATPVQLAVPVPAGTAVGTRVIFMRLGHTLDASGHLRPIWWQVETGTVGADGMAHTASPPSPGAADSGKYIVALGGATIESQLDLDVAIDQAQMLADANAYWSDAQGILSGTPFEPEVAGILATIAIPNGSTPTDPQPLVIEQIPQVGPPSFTTNMVLLDPDKVNTFATTLPPLPGSTPSPSPHISSVALNFPKASGAQPFLVIKGDHLLTSNAGQSLSFGDIKVLFVMPNGDVFQGLQAPGGTASDSELDVLPPPGAVLGLAQIIVRREDTVNVATSGGDGFLSSSEPDDSNLAQLDARGNYVFVALPELPNSLGGTGAVDVLDGTNQDLVAEIPVGNGGPAYPRSVAVTGDNTRAYVTLRGMSAVSVIDALTLQEVAEVALPPGAMPYGIAVDDTHNLAYVADGRPWLDHGDKVSYLYVIDIGAGSPTFDQVIGQLKLDGSDTFAELAVPPFVAPSGLRQVAVSPDGLRVGVAAPNFDANGTEVSGNMVLLELSFATDSRMPNLDLTEGIPGNLGTFGITSLVARPGDFAFTDSETDPIGVIVLNSAAGLKHLIPLDPAQFINSGEDPRRLQVHSASGIAVTADGRYAFVAGRADIANHTFLDQTADPLYNGGNVGIIQGPLGDNPRLVAATRPIAFGYPVDLMLSPDGRYLYVSYQGLRVLGNGNGGVMVYDAQAIINQIEQIQNTGNDSILKLVAIDDLPLTPTGPNTGVRHPNDTIDVKADYHIDYVNYNGGVPVYSVGDPNHAPIATGGFPGGIAQQYSFLTLKPYHNDDKFDWDVGGRTDVTSKIFISTFPSGDGLFPNDTVGTFSGDPNPNRVVDGVDVGNGTTFTLPSTIQLTGGQTYYWGVEATGPDGRVVRASSSFEAPLPQVSTPFSTVTVLTPGTVLDFALGNTAPVPQEIIALGNLITQVGQGGAVLVYDPATGLYSDPTHPGTDGVSSALSAQGKPLVLIFNWTKESDITDSGFAEAAGDALFASLVEFNKLLGSNQLFGSPLHFIGDGRGAVVNDQALRRMDAYFPSVTNIQMTTLDPHDQTGKDKQSSLDLPIKKVIDGLNKVLGLLGKVPYIGQVVTAISKGIDTALKVAEFAGIALDPAPYGDFGDPQIQRWSNVGFFDNYFQHNGGSSNVTLTQDGRAIPGADVNVDLNGRAGFTQDDLFGSFPGFTRGAGLGRAEHAHAGLVRRHHRPEPLVVPAGGRHPDRADLPPAVGPGDPHQQVVHLAQPAVEDPVRGRQRLHPVQRLQLGQPQPVVPRAAGHR